MISEILQAELDAAGVKLEERFVDLAVRINTLGGSLLDDRLSLRDCLYNDDFYVGIDWQQIITGLIPRERHYLNRSLAATFRSMRWDSPESPSLQMLRETPLADLIAYKNSESKAKAFLKIAFEKSPAPYADEYTLAEMPTKRDLEDLLRGMSGIPPRYGNRPFLDLETRRIKRS